MRVSRTFGNYQHKQNEEVGKSKNPTFLRSLSIGTVKMLFFSLFSSTLFTCLLESSRMLVSTSFEDAYTLLLLLLQQNWVFTKFIGVDEHNFKILALYVVGEDMVKVFMFFNTVSPHYRERER